MPRGTQRSVRWKRLRHGAAVAACCLAMVASGARAAEQKANDPLEKLNRATYAFNDALDRMLLRPVARGYKAVTPQPVRGAVSNFLANLYYPTTAVNQFLQGKIVLGLSDSARFLVNTTVGVGGLFDPATKFGLAAHDEDFGQTLGVWGVPPGPYLMIPLYGPSDFRDAPARYVDTYTEVPKYTPRKYHRTRTSYLVRGANGIDQRAQLLGADQAIAQAFDPYALLRDSYVRRRAFLVSDGNIAPEPDEDDDAEPPLPLAPPAPARPTTPRGGDLPHAELLESEAGSILGEPVAQR